MKGQVSQLDRTCQAIINGGGVVIVVDPKRPFESALRKFQRKVERSGIIADVRKRRWYASPGERRRAKRARHQRAVRRRSEKPVHATACRSQ